MNLIAALRTKAGGSPYGGGNTGFSSPFVDAFNKSRAPSPLELIRENLGTAYACGTLNSDLIAATQLRLYIKTGTGEAKSGISKRGDTKRITRKTFDRLDGIIHKQVSGAADVEEVTTHPILDVLANPNIMNEDGVGMSGFNLFNLTQMFQEVVGRCYWWVDKQGIGNTPSSIWILAPQRVSEMPSYGVNANIIDYYQFSGGNGGTIQRYETDEIAPFRMPDLYNVYVGGMSPLRACYEQVRLDRKVDAQTNATLDNGGRPAAVWSPSANGDLGGFLGAPEAERARRAFNRSFAGAGAGGVMVQENAGTLQMLNWPMKDIIAPEMRMMSKTVICNAYGVPTTKLQRSDSNRASAQTGDYAHAKDAGIPRLRRNEAALNSFIVPMYGPEAAQRMFFAYDDPPGLHDDVQEQTQWDAAANRGDVTRNESRARLGLADVPWGDQPLVINTMEAVDESTGIPIPATPEPTEPDEDDKPLTKGDLKESEKRIKAIVKAQAPAVRAVAAGDKIKAIMQRVFGEQRREILSQIDDHHSGVKAQGDKPNMLAKFIPLDAWTPKIVQQASPVIETIMQREGQKLLTRFGATPEQFAVFDKNIPEAAQKLTLKFADSTNQTTSMQLDEALAKLRDEISTSVTTGEPRKLLTDRVNQIFDQADESRAESISRTEASRAVHQGEIQSAKDSGVVSGKSWLLSSDACPECLQLAADNPNPIPLDKTFAELGGEYGSIDGPPLHPNCACSLSWSTLDKDYVQNQSSDE